MAALISGPPYPPYSTFFLNMSLFNPRCLHCPPCQMPPTPRKHTCSRKPPDLGWARQVCAPHSTPRSASPPGWLRLAPLPSSGCTHRGLSRSTAGLIAVKPGFKSQEGLTTAGKRASQDAPSLNSSPVQDAPSLRPSSRERQCGGTGAN